MKKTVLALLAIAFAASAFAGSAPKIGAAAPDFTLPAAEGGKPVALKDLVARNKATVLMFIATQCAVSNAYNTRMAELGKEYQAKGIAVIGINSNKNEPVREIVEHAKKQGFTFPVLKDDGNKIADAYDAQHTPEIYVVDAKGVLVYHGRIDESQRDPKAVKSPDLRNALEAILAGKPVPAAETKAFGCSIKRV